MRRALALLLLAPALAGCLGTSAPPGGLAFTPCEHPWPCADGSEWPRDLEGPFDLGQTLTEPIVSHDGTPLESTIYVPALPEGVRAPVVLWSQPYTGNCAFNWWLGDRPCSPASDDAWIYEGNYRVNVRGLVEHGYAVAVVNVRGTGHSGGCFGFGSVEEQQDQVFLVQWLAQQPWSNGRVAMYGHSYHGFTPWMAAIQSPPALKTVVASGLITDVLTFYYSPQGAPASWGGGFQANMWWTLNLLPPLGGGPEHATVEHAMVLPDRACPEAKAVALEVQQGATTDQRDASFWMPRRLLPGFGNITASVLVSMGFNDASAHAFQDDLVWDALARAPKRFVLGQWGHDLPPPQEFLDDAPFGSDWHEDTLYPWFDFWLKGRGAPPATLGQVDYQVANGGWARSAAWPPVESRQEVLYLTEEGVSPSPGSIAPALFGNGPQAGVPSCFPDAPPESPSNALAYLSAPLEAPVRLAGNAHGLLRLTSDQPGGLVSVDLFDVPGDYRCDDPVGGEGAQWIASAAADLRFHGGNLQGEDFPVGAPTPVRVDFFNDAWDLAPGHRLLVVLSGMGAQANAGRPWTPLLRVHADGEAEATHLVLPLVEGTLGGAAPTIDYPVRPWGA